MKKTLSTLFLLLSISVSFSQTIKGIISHNPKKGIGDDTKLSENAKKPMIFSYIYSKNKSIETLISKEQTTLEINFKEFDSQLQEVPNITIRPYRTINYKDFELDIYRFESSKKDKDFNIEHTSIKDKIPEYNWVLTNDSLKILGFNCKKATTVRNVGRKQNITAWYTEEIPIKDGPISFSGLPGMILQIQIDENSILKFEEIEVLNKLSIKIEEPKNETKMMTISEYLDNLSK